jgi:predicted adenine nucleotide alpha hydrolase (AANH) superfamily ATPase
LKNAAKLNEIGLKLAEEYDVSYLTSDFKKKNGYKRSVELSAQYGLYRQDYCGCVFSKKEAVERKKRTAAEKAKTGENK